MSVSASTRTRVNRVKRFWTALTLGALVLVSVVNGAALFTATRVWFSSSPGGVNYWAVASSMRERKCLPAHDLADLTDQRDIWVFYCEPRPDPRLP